MSMLILAMLENTYIVMWKGQRLRLHWFMMQPCRKALVFGTYSHRTVAGRHRRSKQWLQITRLHYH